MRQTPAFPVVIKRGLSEEPRKVRARICLWCDGQMSNATTSKQHPTKTRFFCEASPPYDEPTCVSWQRASHLQHPSCICKYATGWEIKDQTLNGNGKAGGDRYKVSKPEREREDYKVDVCSSIRCIASALAEVCRQLN